MKAATPAVEAPRDRLRVLVIDKVSVLRSIRERHRRLARCANIDLTLLAPEMWIENLTPTPFQVRDDDEMAVVLGRVIWPGREQRSFYVSGMLRAFRRSRPEVIVMLEESFSLFALQTVLLKKLLAPRAKVIFYSNNITSYDRYAYRPSWFYRILGKAVMRMCDAALCVNTKAEQVLRRTRFDGEIRTKFYGINEALFQPRCRADARRELGIGDDADVFLYAGKLLELKGVQDLIRAFASLCERMPERDLRLVIVGSGEFAPELRQLVSDLQLDSRVDFHQMVPLETMPTFVAAASALVLPSRARIQEQFGRVIAEAMLMNVPVIGSTSGAIPEVIGDGGFIFTAGDVAELRSAMEKILRDDAEVESRRRLARDKAIRDFSMGAFVDEVIDLLEHLTGRTLHPEAGR